MKIIFFVLQCIFAIKIEVLSLQSWDGKLEGVHPVHLNFLKHGVYSVKKRKVGRVAVATAVSESLLISSGHVIKKYKDIPYYEGFFVQVGSKKIAIEYVKYHDKYNALKQREFDIGIIKIKNYNIDIRRVAWLDVSTCVSRNEDLQLITYSAKQVGPCILNVKSVEFRFEIDEGMRQDNPLFVSVENTTDAIMQDCDSGGPVFKDDQLVGIVSYSFKQSAETIIVCTSLIQSEVFTFIKEELEEEENKRSPKRRKIDQD